MATVELTGGRTVGRRDSAVQRALREQNTLEREFRVTIRQTVAKIQDHIRATRGNIDPVYVIGLFAELGNPLLESMVQSYLLGERRVVLTAKEQLGDEINVPRDVTFSLHDDAMEFIESRQNIVAVNGIARTGDAAIYDAANAVVDRIRQSADRQIGKGLHVRDAIDNILSETTGTTRAQAETIFRTENATAYSAGVWNQTQGNSILTEMVTAYTYHAVGDNRTRPEHEAMDGTRAPADHPIWRTWWPPNGYNCRCIVLPDFEEGETSLPYTEVEPDTGFALNPAVRLDEMTGLQMRTMAIEQVPSEFNAVFQNTDSRVESEKNDQEPVERLSRETLDNLTKTDIEAIQAYSGGRGELINAYLRGDKNMPDSVIRDAKRIQRAFGRSVLSEPIQVYRGIRDVQATFGIDEESLRVGGKVKFRGLVSTSYVPEGAFSGVKLVIDVPAGSKAIPMGIGELSFDPAQKEVLLPHGSKYEIIGIDRGSNGVETIRLRMI